MKLSRASERAKNYPTRKNNWNCKITTQEINGIGLEPGVDRRDPSSVIEFEGEYYVYYTKSIGPRNPRNKDPKVKTWPWDCADIAYAVSKDGINWEEKGIAVARGEEGSYDHRTICTPDIMVYEGKYYLIYQCMEHDDYATGTDETVGMAIAENPNGPWRKLDKPILERQEDGFWMEGIEGIEGTFNDTEFEAAVHDPMLLTCNGKFYLYYKCVLQKDRKDLDYIVECQGGRHGVAIADNIEGPYVHSEFNPITNSGHETLLWEYDGGVACLLNRDGPEKNTIQYAKNGIDFEIMSWVADPPPAGGAFRCKDTNEHPLAGIKWGLYHPTKDGWGEWNYIARFDTTIKNK